MIIFVGSEERVDDLEADEDLADSFPCLSTGPLDREARAQLYSLVTGTFLDDAWQLEVLHRGLTEEGPWIYRMDEDLVDRMARLDEDEIGEFAELWLECEELESLDPEVSDLYDFLYQLVGLCRVAADEDDLGLFVYSDI